MRGGVLSSRFTFACSFIYRIQQKPFFARTCVPAINIRAFGRFSGFFVDTLMRVFSCTFINIYQKNEKNDRLIQL